MMSSIASFLPALLRPLLLQLPFLAFAGLDARANARKEVRCRQFIMPVVAAIYCVIAILLFWQCNDQLYTLFRRLFTLLGSLLSYVPVLSGIGESLVSALNGLGDIYGQAGSVSDAGMLSSLNSAGDAASALVSDAEDQINRQFCFLFYTENAAFLAVFVLLKKIIVSHMQKREYRKNALFQRIAGIFYEKDPIRKQKNGDEIWYVKGHFGQARTYLCTLYYVSLIAGIVAAAAGIALLKSQRMTIPYYPLFGAILVGEMYFFLDGMTRSELVEKGELVREQPVEDHGNYDLRDSLKRLFGDKLIASGKENYTAEENTSYSGAVTPGEDTWNSPVSNYRRGQAAEEAADGLRYGNSEQARREPVDRQEYEFDRDNPVETELQRLRSSSDGALRAYGQFMTVQYATMQAYEQSEERHRKNLPYDRMDLNFLRSGADLLQGHSILFNDPFYYDLLPYIFYPVNRTLLCAGRVLVIAGRHNLESDLAGWIREGLEKVTHIPGMWSVEVLREGGNLPDVGILSRADVNNLKIHESCGAFLSDVSFVILVEPSRLLTTAQLGLNSVLRHIDRQKTKVTFCSIDKNCDGLVDSLSHVLMTSLLEVSAMSPASGESAYMIWEGDGTHLQHRMLPNISRYLGFGTELSFFALRNMVPQTDWYGGSRFPVMEYQWIARQYFRELLQYAGLPVEQEAMKVYFHLSANLWNARIQDNHYLTVEDESNNMFEVRREFATRARKKGFVNVISGHYLLGDYMAANHGIFDADPKAIPYVVADYAHTRRNVILRLCLRMTSGEVPASEIRQELELVEIDTRNRSLTDVLWDEICSLEEPIGGKHYNEYQERYLVLPGTDGGAEHVLYENILQIHQKFSFSTGNLEDQYYITDPDFIRYLMRDLQNAGYISEDEQETGSFLGTELLGHIYQKYLPGEFFTMNGRYYQMVRVSADQKILARRAADHITGRPCYRQVREYTVAHVTDSDVMGDRINIGGMKVSRRYADITVRTPAYYTMGTYNDFAGGKRVEVNGIPIRTFYNKQVLEIVLPFAGKQEGDHRKITATIALLMNEIFQTLFAENADYLAAVAAGRAELPSTYSLFGAGDADNCIYIIEDSQLDIGLLDAVRRNLQRIFSIMCDYLAWNEEAIEKSRKAAAKGAEDEEEEGEQPPFGEDSTEDSDGTEGTAGGKKRKARGGFFGAIGRAIGGLFRKIGGAFAGRAERRKKKKQEKETQEQERKEQEKEKQEQVRKEEERKEQEREEQEQVREEQEERKEQEREEQEREAQQAKEQEKKESEERETEGETEKPAEEKEKKEQEEPNEHVAQEAMPKEADSIDSEEDYGNREDPAAAVTAEQSKEAEEDMEADATSPSDSDDVITMGKPGGVSAGPDEMEYEDEGAVRGSEQADSSLVSRKPYHKRYYLLYGGEKESDALACHDTLRYLQELGYGGSELEQARKGQDLSRKIALGLRVSGDQHRCDFCGALLVGDQYEVLRDGRERCPKCSAEAIRSAREFEELYATVRSNMQNFFGIRFLYPVSVKMVNIKRLQKMRGEPEIQITPGFDARSPAFAQMKTDRRGNHSFSLYIENGCTKRYAASAIAHELTHIWQFTYWDLEHMAAQYGQSHMKELMEGMAVWAEIQYDYLAGDPGQAELEEANVVENNKNNEYGIGYARYLKKYPMSRGQSLKHKTPFQNPKRPL